MLIGIPVYDDVDIRDVAAPSEMFQWAGLEVEFAVQVARFVRFRNELSRAAKTAFGALRRSGIIAAGSGPPFERPESHVQSPIHREPAKGCIDAPAARAYGVQP